LRFKIDRTSLMVGSKCTVFALFDFVFEGNFPRSDLTEGFLHYRFGGLIFGILRYTCINIREGVTWQVMRVVVRK